MGHDNPFEGHRSHTLGTVVVTLLGSSQQWVKYLDRCLKHLYELHQALVRMTEGSGEAVGVGIVLWKLFQHPDIHLTDKAGDILVILITGLGFGYRNLVQDGGVEFYDPELGNVAAELMQAFYRPG